MKPRLSSLIPAFLAFAALLGGLLVAAPADAASASAVLRSQGISLTSKGTGQVVLTCRSSKPCKGSIRFAGATKTTRYHVARKSSRAVPVAINRGSSLNPYTHGTSVNGQYKRVGAVLKISETSPRRVNHQYAVSLETVLRTQQITGTVSGPAGAGVRGLRVELIRSLRGGNSEVVRYDDNLANGYSFNVRLSANNGPSEVFRLRVSGIDQNGIYRAWYWRGSDGRPAGGSRYLNEGSGIRAYKSSNYDANFRYSTIKGSAPSGTGITVAAPSVKGGGIVARRERDLVGCADIFGETTATNGRYRVDFLPVTPSSPDKRYMVGAKRGAEETWNNNFGSCFDVLDYRGSRANLLAVTTTPASYNVAATASNTNVAVNGSFSGFTGTKQGDRWIRLREKIPGVPILDAPVVAEKAASADANATFYDVRPGRYWVEVGRRSGCADWYKSVYPNNRVYLNGEDRGNEAWKAFTTLRSLKGNAKSGLEYLARTANPNPATDAEQGKRPAGGAGWMYRTHCKALGAGSISTVNVSGRNRGTIAMKAKADKKGAVVRGHVVRIGGATNKEVLVRLSSTDGTRVIRTDITNSGGNFYVAGLAPGRWTISVNPDSWRGIERMFKGRHVINVKAGRSYSVGTLKLRGSKKSREKAADPDL